MGSGERPTDVGPFLVGDDATPPAVLTRGEAGERGGAIRQVSPHRLWELAGKPGSAPVQPPRLARPELEQSRFEPSTLRLIDAYNAQHGHDVPSAMSWLRDRRVAKPSGHPPPSKPPIVGVASLRGCAGCGRLFAVSDGGGSQERLTNSSLASLPAFFCEGCVASGGGEQGG